MQVTEKLGFLSLQGEEGSPMKFTIVITRDEDGMYIAECPAIPGCVSQGKTEDEAQANIQDAIKQYLEVRAEKGMPLTVTTRQSAKDPALGIVNLAGWIGRRDLSDRHDALLA